MSLIRKGSLIRGGGVVAPQPVYAPKFDGLTQYAAIQDPLELRIANDVDFELGVKVKREDWNGGAFAMCSRQSSSYGLNFYLSNNGNSGSGSISVFGTTLSSSGFQSGVEYEISVRRVGADWALLVDGVEVSTASGISISTLNAIDAFSLMARDDNSFRVNGTVRDLFLKVNGNLVYLNKIGTKDSSIQSPSTGSSDVTIINHTNAMWVEV